MSKPQYFWGNDNPEDMKLMGIAILFALTANSITLFLFSETITSSGPAIESGLSLDSMRGVLMVTLGWIFCFLSAMGGQIRTKMEMAENADAEYLAKRAMYNSIEHAFPSLFMIWLAAIYCNAGAASVLGGLYVLGRLFYPILYGWYGHFTLFVEFATQLGYFALGGLLLSLYGQVFFDDPLIAVVVQHWYMPFWLLGAWLLFSLIQINLVGFGIYFPIYKRGLDWKQRFDEYSAQNENTDHRKEQSQ